MAIEHQSFLKTNFASLTCICFALVTLFQIYQLSGTECATVDLISTRMIGEGGVQAHRGQWPFIAALYLSNQSEYFCGGTLISNKNVLTAAHCMHPKGSAQKLSYCDIEVRLGAYNLTDKDDKDAVLRNVTDIFVHPDWKENNNDYDADLAILVLNDKVIFTTNIQPVSLPTNFVVFDGSYIDLNGTIVGWGIAGSTTHEEIPRQVDIRAFSHSYCFLTHRDMLYLSSNRTFCAGSEQGDPSRGDSGGGFFVNTDGAWEQYGIISAIRTDSKGSAIRSMVAVYTNVKLFQSWIVERV